MSIHNHHWVYLCDALLPFTEEDLQVVEAEPKRLLYCMHCSTVAVQLGSKLSEVQGTITKDFLKNFEKTTDHVVKKPPPEFLFRPSKVLPPQKRRLGRGLAELLSSSPANGIRGLLPKKES